MTGNLADLTGQEIAHYRIVRRIGGGAMAGVYQATDQILDKTVALKVLLMGADDLTRQRFRQEARTGSSLEHPHIVRTLQVGQTSADGIAYIAMELVEGLSLSELLDDHRALSIADTSNLLEPIARALAFAHDKGIVHRDVKPSNILLRFVALGTPHSTQLSAIESAVVPLLSDFGISRALDSPELTNAGRTIGTPSYMAPEQCAGSREVDGRADIYSLGTVLYRCLVGRAPYVGTTTQILHAHVYEPLTIPDDVLTELPNSIIGVLKHSLMKEPENRYQDVDMMARQLLRTKIVGINRLVSSDTVTAESSGIERLPFDAATGMDETRNDAVSTTVTVDSLITTDFEGDNLFDRDKEASVLVSGTETTSAVATTVDSKSTSAARVPTKPATSIKLGSTTHQRVTRPLPPPIPKATKQRNWAGLVIGAVMMLIVLFGGIATVRSLWPSEEFPATTTTATTSGSDNEPKIDEQSSELDETDRSAVSDKSENEDSSSIVDSATGDSPAAASVSANQEADSEESAFSEADEVEAEIGTGETGPSDDGANGAKDAQSEAAGSSETDVAVSAITAGYWDDVQFFYERRDWHDALDSLILMRRSDDAYQPEQVDVISFNVYMGLAALEMQEMLKVDISTGNQLKTDAVMKSGLLIDEQKVAMIASHYDNAIKIQPESTAAQSLLAATDNLAVSIPAESVADEDELTIFDSAVADLRSTYASYSASLALKGNYCSAVEQLSVSLLLDYQIAQIDQLTSYLDECPDLDGILATLEEQRRIEQFAKTPTVQSTRVVESVPATATAISSTADSNTVTSGTVTSNTVTRPTSAASPTMTAPSRATATTVAPAPTSTSVPVVDTNFIARLTGTILYSSQEQGQNVIWRLPAAPDSSSNVLIESARLPTVHPNGQLVTYHSDDKEGIRGFDMVGGLPLPERNFIQFIYHPEAAQFSPATWSPSGGSMLFVSTVDGDRVPRIYSAQNNSTGNYLYVNYGREPDWHPFDDLIVYKGADETGNRPGLWLMNSSGDNKQRFSENAGDSRPVWSANGRDIIFMSNSRSASWDIYSANYETRTVTQLTSDPANDGLPTISPDGKYVAFLSNRGGIWQIFVMPVTGGQSQVLAPIRGSLPNWLEHAIHWIR